MTDEERQKLCDGLRHLPQYLDELGSAAADEIERLVAKNEKLAGWTDTADILLKMSTDEIERLAIAQSDAEPWRCPIGIAPESHSICSVGSCWWCLSDRVVRDTKRWGFPDED